MALAHRIRYVMQFNAREAMHLIELRSGTQGHPAYRRVAQEMHRAIAEVAGHRALAEAMSFVDHGATDLERLESERRAERRRAGKICNALTRKYLRSPWWRAPSSPLTGPPPSCLMYGAVPDAPKDAADDESAEAVRGGVL